MLPLPTLVPDEHGRRCEVDGDGRESSALSSMERSVARLDEVGLWATLPAELRDECAMRGLVK